LTEGSGRIWIRRNRPLPATVRQNATNCRVRMEKVCSIKTTN